MDIEQMIDADFRARHERVRQVIFESGRPDLVAELDAKMRDIRLGIDGARRTWNALSAAQKRVLSVMATGRTLRRASRTRYDAYGETHAESNVCGIATVRNLCARELCHVDGGARME